MQSSTGFHVNPRAKEIVSFPNSVRKTGLRTECCAVCAEHVHGSPTRLDVRRQQTGAAIVGLLLYAGAVALLSYAPDWLWYHSDRLTPARFGLMAEVLGRWMLWLPAVAVIVSGVFMKFAGRISVDAPTCHSCETEVLRTKGKRKTLTIVSLALSVGVGIAGTVFVELPIGMVLVIAVPVFLGLRAAVSASWPAVLTWHGTKGRRMLLGVTPRLARHLTSTGRAAEVRASRARLLIGPIAVLGIALATFAAAGDHPVCPIDAAPVTVDETTIDGEQVTVQSCLDTDGKVHGRLIARSQNRHMPVVIGGASHGVPSGLWWRHATAVDALTMRLDEGDPFVRLGLPVRTLTEQ